MATLPHKTLLSAEALNARRQYAADWREKNREKLRAYNRQYALEHPVAPEKRALYNASYWQRKADALRDGSQRTGSDYSEEARA